MSDFKIHMKIYKTIITVLVLIFSLSPCSIKRNLLDIFDIEYINTFNKVKITYQASGCSGSTEFKSTKTIVSKGDLKSDHHPFSFRIPAFCFSTEGQKSLNNYSGYTSGNSPPKYILFKRLKISMA
ncbi:hypothetical protein IQ37_05225 [Chryseobacterium piperi]|uniref:Uncharacterized protein n=2 Tax=Chryseobacterium piperi TaxID=558152 RepID=A0A086BKG0_9FLAO|nr:hypothetical protein IQ37_05225 [Chryseobacterium piperi]